MVILRCNPNLTPYIQACLSLALAALHNVICEYDQDDQDDFLDDSDFADQDFDEMILELRDAGELANGPPRQSEKRDADERQNEIAEHMWIQCQAVLASRGEL